MRLKPMWRGILTLLLGAGAAQLGPLLLGPLLSRLYGPEVFGLFHLASTVAANIAVVACARYEFALPLAPDEAHARALRRLCTRVLVGVTLLTLLGSAVAAVWQQALWPLAIAPLVGVTGALSLWTLEATRGQRYGAMATARLTQFWGGSGLQLVLGWLQAGIWSLLLGPIVAALAAALGLQRACRDGVRNAEPGVETAAGPAAEPHWREIAHRYRDFPLLNTPHAFLGVLQDTLSLMVIAAWAGPAAAGVWGLVLRYLKAPATLAGGAVSQVLYPVLGAAGSVTRQSRSHLRRVMVGLMAAGAVLGALVYWGSAWALPALLGPGWEEAGPVGRALAVYVAVHFVASPLGVVTLAWNAQAWALRVSWVGHALFVAALAWGLGGPPSSPGSLAGAAGWVSAAMALFFAWYFWRLWHWPLQDPASRDNPVIQSP